MAPARVERWDVHGDGPLSEIALQKKIEAFGYEVVARIYPAGRVEFPPVGGSSSLTAVVRGLINLHVDGAPVSLAAGDVAFVEAGCGRTIEVVGPSTVLCLDALPRARKSGVPSA